MEIGKQIKTLRLSKGVTQEELAEYLGVSFQAVSKWETESSTPDIALLPNIAVFFGITIDELFHIPNEAEFERIENMFWHKRRINPETFSHCIRFLEGVLQDDPKISGLTPVWHTYITTEPKATMRLPANMQKKFSR